MFSSQKAQPDSQQLVESGNPGQLLLSLVIGMLTGLPAGKVGGDVRAIEVDHDNELIGIAVAAGVRSETSGSGAGEHGS